MWVKMKVLCCPKNPEYKYDNSNLGFLDQCFTCERVEKCRETIKKFEDAMKKILEEKPENKDPIQELEERKEIFQKALWERKCPRCEKAVAKLNGKIGMFECPKCGLQFPPFIIPSEKCKEEITKL